MFTTNQITSALVAYRSAADQDTATASSIAAALLSYYTVAQVDGLLANKLGVTEAASALQIAVRFPDEVVAAIGEQILAPTDVSLSNWTVRPSSGCSVVLATRTAGVSVDGYTLTVEHCAHLQLDARPRAPLRLPLPARHGLQLRGAHVRGFAGDEGAWSTAKMYFTVPPNGVAKLHFGAHFQAPGLPNQTAGTVDVYGLQGNMEEEDAAASALLLKHEFLDDVTLATLGEVLLEPTLTTLGNFLVRSNSQSSVALASFTVGGFQLEGYAMTLVPTGHGLQLGDVRQRGRQRLRGRHRHLPWHGLAGRLEHGAPGLLGAAGAGAAVGGHAGPVLLCRSLALTGSATLDGLTAQGNVAATSCCATT